MKVYALTDLGKKVVRNSVGSASQEEMKVLNYLRDYRTATDDQLDTVGERYVVRGLVRSKLVKELTQG